MRRVPHRVGNREGPGRRGEPLTVPRPARDAEGLGPDSQRHMGSVRVWERQLSGSAPAWPGSCPRGQPSLRAPPIPRVEQSFRGPRPADSQGGTELAVLPRILPQKLCYMMGINHPKYAEMLICSLNQVNIIHIMGELQELTAARHCSQGPTGTASQLRPSCWW